MLTMQYAKYAKYAKPVKVVNAWVRSAFGNVYFSHQLHLFSAAPPVHCAPFKNRQKAVSIYRQQRDQVWDGIACLKI